MQDNILNVQQYLYIKKSEPELLTVRWLKWLAVGVLTLDRITSLSGVATTGCGEIDSDWHSNSSWPRGNKWTLRQCLLQESHLWEGIPPLCHPFQKWSPKCIPGFRIPYLNMVKGCDNEWCICSCWITIQRLLQQKCSMQCEVWMGTSLNVANWNLSLPYYINFTWTGILHWPNQDDTMFQWTKCLLEIKWH
jgi:hypothetical protein